MIQATCAQARLISAGVDARIGLVEIDGTEHHAICVWRVTPSSRLWCYDGEGTFETYATNWADTDAIAVSCRAALRRQFLVVKWDRWVPSVTPKEIQIISQVNQTKEQRP
jgi:hypothetical protein